MQKSSLIPNQRINQKSSAPVFGQSRSSSFFQPRFQPKLIINPSNNIYQQEADKMEDKIMRKAIPSTNDNLFFKPSASTIQRKCAHCEEEQKQMQRKENSNQETKAEISVENYVDSLNGSGKSLDASTKKFFEPRFGYDFSGVKIHTDPKAAKSAQSVNALAYTVGNNIVFNQNQFSFETDNGKKLLAHELTHVVQQSDSDGSSNENRDGHIAPSFNGQTILLQRQEANKHQSCAGWTCLADLSACDRPDPGKTGNGATSISWSLSAMIDVDVPTPEEVGINTLGHSYVKFSESNGAEYTYGFYPRTAAEVALGGVRATPGCIVHPDITHEPCVDYKESFTLTKAEYDNGLSNANLWCRAIPTYELFNVNCTTFVAKVVEAAGKSLPSYRGKVSPAGVTADNPNTLLNSLQARDEAKKPISELFANEIISLIDSQNDRSAFNILDGMWMVVMLEVLTELNKRKYLDHLFDFFAVAQDVNKPRLMAAMQAVRLNLSNAKPSSQQIQEILKIDHVLPEQQKQEIAAYLDK